VTWAGLFPLWGRIVTLPRKERLTYQEVREGRRLNLGPTCLFPLAPTHAFPDSLWRIQIKTIPKTPWIKGGVRVLTAQSDGARPGFYRSKSPASLLKESHKIAAPETRDLSLERMLTQLRL
jgi:hypothetical protein